MAKGRAGRGPTRLDKRREAEAVEARDKDDDREEAEEEVEEEAEGEEGDDEEGGKKKKAAKKKAVKKPAAAKKPATKRTRTPKEVRRKAVWVVFDNSNKPVGTFAFNEKEQAEAALAKKIEEKKGTFFLNLIKEEIKSEE
jgi:hypothetical protein